MSSLNLDMGVKEHFEGSTSEICYGDVRLQPLKFQDDLSRMSTSVNAAQEGNTKVAEITNIKQLEINIDKSSYILIGNTEVVNNMRDQINFCQFCKIIQSDHADLGETSFCFLINSRNPCLAFYIHSFFL